MTGARLSDLVRFLCSTVLKSSLDATLPLFEADGGRADVSYGPSAQLCKRLSEGEAADAAVVTAAGFDELTRLGTLVVASRVPLARSVTMVAVKKGTSWPDISTMERFRQSMLDARSVVYSAPGSGATGAHMINVMNRLGIAEAMGPKTILGPGGPAGLIGHYLTRGEAEIGFQQDSELMAFPEVDIVGPLPGELGLVTEFVFGVHAAARDAEAARALGAFLRSPANLAAMKRKGLTPA